MIKAIMHGCNGHMGQVISEICAADPEIEIVAGIDLNTEEKFDYPVFADLASCNVPADVIIDFSNAAAIDALIAHAAATKTPVVLCTTGLSEAQIAAARAASETVPVLKSANMSLGINTLMDTLKKATAIYAEAGFDIEIVEKHHNQKLDAPSGTALALADSCNESGKFTYTYDRSQQRAKRTENEIGISAVRGGTIVGEHEVIFAGLDEVITFKHTAYSKSVFATGAVQAAKFLAGQPAGLYDMKDVITGRKTEGLSR